MSAMTSTSSETTTLTYDGYTIDADMANDYAELYDTNGNLIAQFSWGVDSAGELTATGVGPSQSATVTMPTASAAAAAGSVRVGNSAASLNNANSSFTVSSNGQDVMDETVGSDGTATMSPLTYALSPLTFRTHVNPGGGGGGGPRPLTGVRPMSVSGSCASAFLAALAMMTLVAYALVDLVVVSCGGGPEEAPICAAAGILAGAMYQQAAQSLAQMVSGACEQ
ncbi:MAG TPA: hypothetical protein VIN40_05970 [Candidatus Tyrphobacter sp.]